MVGSTISHYHVMNTLGGGGMGVVFWLKMEPMYDTLRASSRFSSLFAKVGLPA